MRIIVVEDEAKIATSLLKGLGFEGYIVDVASDSDQADVMVRSQSYDLALVDWMLPGSCDGPALIKMWRKAGYEMPILLLTARGAIGDKVTGLDSGADDYLPKPFSFDELLARIRALLRRPKKNVGVVLEANGLRIDTVAKIASVAGQRVQLTAKEMQLLEFLLTRKGEVVSKDQLLDHVWGDEVRVQRNTVETFVANIRKKVGADVIETVRGYGYKV
jgi:two-component system, OmpR family, response regulator